MLDKHVKILFAPHEIGGQMQLMVEESARRGHYATAAAYGQEWAGHVNDVHLDLPRLRSSWRKHLRVLLFTAWAASTYDIFHFFWGESLYGFGSHRHLDLPLLRRLGKKVLVHFRGLDVVDLAYFDYLRAKTAGDAVQKPRLTRPDQQASLVRWRRYAHRMLVSEPDLFAVVPEAVLVQQAIDLRAWEPARATPQSAADGVIRIAHAPTMRRKKGTEFVVAAVDELKAQGYPVELVLIEKLPYQQVKHEYERCDIGVDQVLYGWYGKVSLELMALRRPVVCYIDPDLVHHRADMPIVNAAPATLTTQLRALVEDAPRRQELGARGREYVERYHSVERIMDQCLGIYEELGAARAPAGQPAVETAPGGPTANRPPARTGPD